MIKELVIGAAMCSLVASTAMAHELNVYDGAGKLVGPLVGQNTALVTLGGFQQYLTIGQHSFAINAQLYFGDPDCEAPTPLAAFDSWAELFPHAVYDGQTLYYLDPRQDAGLAVQSRIVDGKCEHLPDNQVLIGTSAHPVASPWSPPFSVK